MIHFVSEEQLLNKEFRVQVIKELVYGEENRERKAEALRRHEIYKDKNKKWVMKAIEREGFKKETVEQMRNRATNIGICKKITNKKATTYTGGLDRTLGEPLQKPNPLYKKPEEVNPVILKPGEEPTAPEAPEEKDPLELKTDAPEFLVVANPDQASMDMLTDELDFNTAMRKADKWRELQKNCIVGTLPIQCGLNEMGLPQYDLQVQVRAPWQYDVIPSPHDVTKMAVTILCDFPDRSEFEKFATPEAIEGIRSVAQLSGGQVDNSSKTIAGYKDNDLPDASQRFIFWSDNYHFTCDLNGDIVASASPADLRNPIKKNPWVSIAMDRDDSFWAEGGSDIVDTSILINKKLTDVNFISFIQGWGQLVVAAEDIPEKLLGGPDNAFLFTKRSGGTVEVFFATSNPPIEKWLETIQMTLAMVLSTNNLATRSVAVKLDVQNAASGISMLIENSESIGDVTDVQEIFKDKEPEIWERIALWHSFYHGLNALTPRFQDIQPMKQWDVNLKFHQIKSPMSEKERLETLKLRQDIGLSTLVDLVKMDNPDLTEEEARQKADELLSEKKKMSQFISKVAQNETDKGVKNGDEENEDDESSPDSKREDASGDGAQEG